MIEGFLTGGNKADISFADELSANVFGCYILGDKGYDSNRHRENLISNNNIFRLYRLERTVLRPSSMIKRDLSYVER